VYPLTALLIGAGFYLSYLKNRGRALMVAAICWWLYLVYECLIFFKVICSGDCSIRVDLLVIYPLLAVISATGVFYHLWKSKKPSA